MLCCFLCCIKQRWSVLFLTINSFLLFVSSSFVMYIAVCLYTGQQIFGQGTESQGATLSINSYLMMLTLLISCFGILISFLGCCTSRTKDRCSVSFFTIIGIVLFATTSFTAGVVIIFSHN